MSVAIEKAPAPHRTEQDAPRQGLSLRSAEFRKGREEGWRRLEELIARVDKRGVGALSPDEVQQLPLLYRAAVSSLSVARAIALDRNLLLYLEDLSLRSYLAVYGPRSGIARNLSGFLARGFPEAVRALKWPFLIAFLAMAAGVAAGYLLVWADINYFNMLIPEEVAQERGPGSTAKELNDAIFAPWPGYVESFVVFANSLFRHNSMVGVLCFGLGFALGVPTFLLLVYQGLILGAFVALHVEKGLGVDFVGWLSIHGVTEILAILLCGAAGLAIGGRIVFPGRMTRLESLSRYGRQAAAVAAGAMLMFFVAGILEGGFRQLINDTYGRYAFGLVTGALWFAYFSSGRKGRAA